MSHVYGCLFKRYFFQKIYKKSLLQKRIENELRESISGFCYTIFEHFPYSAGFTVFQQNWNQICIRFDRFKPLCWNKVEQEPNVLIWE